MRGDPDLGPGEPPALERGGIAEQIIADLQDQILRGKLPRGTRLPNERALAEHYRVSGATVREAVRGLAAMKLVEPRHGAGTFVTAEADLMLAVAASAFLELNKVRLVDILDLLATLNEKIGVLACANATEEELEHLPTLLDALEQAEGSEAFPAALAIFLGALADASHNPLMASFAKLLVRLLIELVNDQWGGFATAEVPAKVRGDRRRLVEALLARDAECAGPLAARYHSHTHDLVSSLPAVVAAQNDDHMQRAYRRLRQSVEQKPAADAKSGPRERRPRG